MLPKLRNLVPILIYIIILSIDKVSSTLMVDPGQPNEFVVDDGQANVVHFDYDDPNYSAPQKSVADAPLISGSSKKMEDLTLDFYKQKTLTLRNFLNSTILTLIDLKDNMTNLLESSINSLQEFKEKDEILNENFNQLENQLEKNQLIRQNFNQLLFDAENHLQNFQSNFLHLLKPNLDTNQEANGDGSPPCGGTLIVSTSPMTLTYQRLPAKTLMMNNMKETCMWLVYSKTGHELTLTQLDGGLKAQSVLSIHNVSDADIHTIDILKASDVNKEINSPSTLLIVTFTSPKYIGRPGFQLQLAPVKNNGLFEHALSNGLNFRFINV